jgi:hypothetical protein
MMVASTSVPRLMTKPRASSCRLTSAKSADERPSLSIVWRNRQIEAWSGVSTSNGRPQKRRNDNRLRTASSAAGSESVCHCCRSRILNIVKGG